MDHWSIKDLKTFCEQHGIDHHDCVEKPELVKVASAHAEGLFAAHKSSGAKSSGAKSSGASATGASAAGASAASTGGGSSSGAKSSGASAATASGGSSSSEATPKARVNLENLAVGARLYEKYTEASRALGLDDVGTSEAVRATTCSSAPAERLPPSCSPDSPARPCAAAAALSFLLAWRRSLRLSTRSTRSWRASTTPIRIQTTPRVQRPGASSSPLTPSLR